MKVTPVAAAPSAQPASMQSPAQNDARARAIAMVAGTQDTHSNHSVNPNNISPEEQSAVVAPKQQTEETPVKSATTEDTEPKAPEKDPEVVKQYQEIARQERILRAKAQKQQQELQQQKAAIEAQKTALDARSKEYESGYISKDRFKADPISTLEEMGLSYEEITQQMISRQPKDPRVEATISRLEAKIAQLESKTAEVETNAKQAQTDSYQAALRQIETDVKKLVTSDPEAYEAIAKTNSIKDVVELIEQTYQKDGILMTSAEAAEEVENYLIEESLSQVSRIDKIQKRLAQQAASTAAAAQVKQEDTKAKPEETTMKTLTNTVSSTRKLSARERALLAFKGEKHG